MDAIRVPETRYARSGEINIAYQVVGEGPLDLVFVPVISRLELVWESALQAQFFNRLASISRLIILNQRGTGMSDPVPGVPTLEVRMDDIGGFMDATASRRAVIFGLGDSGPLCTLFAATYTERTSGLVLMNSSPGSRATPSSPGCRRERRTSRARRSTSGDGAGLRSSTSYYEK